jgi:hypothetical protein
MPYAKVFLDSETETFAQLDADRNKPLVQGFNAMFGEQPKTYEPVLPEEFEHVTVSRGMKFSGGVWVNLDSPNEVTLSEDREQLTSAMCDICDLASDLTTGDAAAILKRIHDIAISALDGEYVSANGEN